MAGKGAIVSNSTFDNNSVVVEVVAQFVSTATAGQTTDLVFTLDYSSGTPWTETLTLQAVTPPVIVTVCLLLYYLDRNLRKMQEAPKTLRLSFSLVRSTSDEMRNVPITELYTKIYEIIQIFGEISPLI